MDGSKKDLMELLSDLNKVDFYQTNQHIYLGKKVNEYVNSSMQSMQSMHNLVVSLFRGFIEENTLLKSRIMQLEQQLDVLKKHGDQIDNLQNLCENCNKSVEVFQDWTRKRFEDQDERFAGIEEREDWTRKRFEGQDKRLESGEMFQDWTRKRFEDQDERFAGIEEREDWTRRRFENQDERFAGIEEREDWTRKRFEDQDERFAGIEEREDWTRKRFEGQDKRFAGIEEREDWTRKWFESQDKRLEKGTINRERN